MYMYILWQSVCTLYLLTCQVRVTIGDSGLCGVQALINCPFPQLMLYPALSSVSILRLKCTSWLRSRLVSPSRPASERDIHRHYDIIVWRNRISMRIPVKNSLCVCERYARFPYVLGNSLMNCTVTYWTLSLVYGFTGCPVVPMTVLDPHWVRHSQEFQWLDAFSVLTGKNQNWNQWNLNLKTKCLREKRQRRQSWRLRRQLLRLQNPAEKKKRSETEMNCLQA